MSLIELRNISKSYGKGNNMLFALDNVNIEIEKGELVAIMGPSGSGKSTLLNILGFLDKQTKGDYIFDGKVMKNMSDNKLATIRNEKIGFVFQSFNLLNEKSILDNVLVPLKFSSKKIKNRKEKAKELIKSLGIEENVKKKPTQMSGGQQQRIAIARALINEPDIILADEPTGALDKKTGKEVMDILEKLSKEGRTVIVVTHDLDVGARCNRIIKICDGKIESNC